MRHTARAIIIQDKKILLVTGRDKGHFWTPGGKLEVGESSEEALHRELAEELNVRIAEYQHFSSYVYKDQKVDNFLVKVKGDVTPSNEISDFLWYDSSSSLDISPGFKQMLLPELIKNQYIN